MMRIVVARIALRPMRSPREPQRNAPSGRTRNDSANTANVLSSATVRSSDGKKTTAIVVAR